MGTESKRDDVEKTETTVAAPRPRRRFSDRLEFKRGQVDGRAGRAPACMQPQYVAGYADARRQVRATRKSKAVVVQDAEPGPARLRA